MTKRPICRGRCFPGLFRCSSYAFLLLSHSIISHVCPYACVCVRACVRACVRVCVRARVHAIACQAKCYFDKHYDPLVLPPVVKQYFTLNPVEAPPEKAGKKGKKSKKKK